MNQNPMLNENLSKEQKLDFLYLMVENDLRVRSYYDPNSNKNIDIKYEVLTKIMNHEELTDEEKMDKRVWEKMPNYVTLDTIIM